jgi:hypothetical protein
MQTAKLNGKQKTEQRIKNCKRLERIQMGNSFPPSVIRKLDHYVYRSIDPRNGETFYVGKGVRNRVFDHVSESLKLDDPSEKLGRIREIKAAGFEVGHVIHRHDLDSNTAFEVEAALIDAYPGLTNEVAGSGSGDHGVMHADEVIRKYEAKVAKFSHRVILINVSRTVANQELYEATRYAWKLNAKRARRSEVVLAVRNGLIIAAFVAEQWLPATEANFPGRSSVEGRFGFVGSEASASISNQYVGKRVPDSFRKRGAANPVRYTYR